MGFTIINPYLFAAAPAGYDPSTVFPIFIDPSQTSSLKQERTGAAATTAVAVGDPVGTAANIGTGGGYFVAPSDTARPILRQSGALYYLEFDGSDDVLTLSQTFNMNAGHHWFMTAEEKGAGTNINRRFISVYLSTQSRDWSNAYGMSVNSNSTSNYIGVEGGGGGGINLTAAGSNAMPKSTMEGWQKNDGSAALWRAGSSQATQAAGIDKPTNGANRVQIGAGWDSSAIAVHVQADIYGFAMYAGELGGTDQTDMRTFMADLGGL